MKAQIGIFTTDTDLVVSSWDTWMEQVTGRPAKAVCGRKLTDLFPDLESRGLLAPFRRVLEQGAVELLAPAFHSYLINCPPQNPSSKFDRMQQRAVIAPLKAEKNITGLAITVEDVTSRREREMEMLTDLGNDDWRVRRQAAEDLSTDAGETPLLELIRRFRQEHRDSSILNAVLLVLVSGPWEALSPLLELARDADDEVRMYAALALGDLKDRGAIQDLIPLLRDHNANVRYHAIEALSKLKATEAVDPLLRIAESGEFFLAFAALDALAEIGEARAARRIVPLLENELVQSAAVGALAKLGDDSVVAPIVSFLDRPPMVSTVVQALVTIHRRYEDLFGEGDHIADLVRRQISPAGARNITGALNDAPGNVLRALVRVMGWIGTEHLSGILAQLLGSAEVRAEVVEMLVRQGHHLTAPLCSQLDSQDLNTRRAAIMALARIGDPESVPALVRALDDPELTVEAAGALAKIGDAKAYVPLLQLLSNERAAVRLAAIGALSSLGDTRTATDVLRLLKSTDPHTRESAVRIAGYFGYPECAQQVMELVHDPDENVRRAAVEGLPHIDDTRVLDMLLTAARDKSPKIRSAAVQAFAYVEDASRVPELLRALDDHDVWVRYYAARSLGQVESPEAIEKLSATLKDDSAAQVRIAAADALGSIGGARAVSLLAPLVESDDSDLARAALTALGSIGHPNPFDPISTALRSDDPARRLDAIQATAARKDKQAADALQWTAAVDRDPAVSEAAMRELARMEIPEAITSLIRLTADRRLRERSVSMISKVGAAHIEQMAAGLRSPQLEVRRAVIDALGRMRHPKASEVLGTALDDEEPGIRLAAVLALKRLGSHTSERKLLQMAHRDPDREVRKAAERDPGAA